MNRFQRRHSKALRPQVTVPQLRINGRLLKWVKPGDPRPETCSCCEASLAKADVAGTMKNRRTGLTAQLCVECYGIDGLGGGGDSVAPGDRGGHLAATEEVHQQPDPARI